MLPLSEALLVPRVAAACSVIPIPPNPWNWWLTVYMEQFHSCHSVQFTQLKWAIWCIPPPPPPSAVVCWSLRMNWKFSAELWYSGGKMQKSKTSGWFRHLLCSFLFHWTLWTGTLYPSAQKYYMLCFLAFSIWSLYVGVFREFPRKVIPASAFSYLHFCCSLHVAHTYWQVFLAGVKYKCMLCRCLVTPSLSKELPFL